MARMGKFVLIRENLCFPMANLTIAHLLYHSKLKTITQSRELPHVEETHARSRTDARGRIHDGEEGHADAGLLSVH